MSVYLMSMSVYSFSCKLYYWLKLASCKQDTATGLKDVYNCTLLSLDLIRDNGFMYKVAFDHFPCFYAKTSIKTP